MLYVVNFELILQFADAYASINIDYSQFFESFPSKNESHMMQYRQHAKSDIGKFHFAPIRYATELRELRL
jgi:hypothetical protein